jgi:hypothetical protein
MYTVTHFYLTTGDDGAAVVEVETRNVPDIAYVADLVKHMIENPGGASGTTISLSVGLNQSTSL